VGLQVARGLGAPILGKVESFLLGSPVPPPWHRRSIAADAHADAADAHAADAHADADADTPRTEIALLFAIMTPTASPMVHFPFLLCKLQWARNEM
jgi:hypothetical protein